MTINKSRTNYLKITLVLFSILFIFTILPTTFIVFAQESKPLISFCENDIEININESQTNLVVDFAINEIIGEQVTSFATLTNDEDFPIVGAPINFYVSNEDKQLKWIGQAITDCYGVGILRFDREQSGLLQITAKFEGGNGLTEIESTATMELKRIVDNNLDTIEWNSIGITVILIIVISAATILAYFVVKDDRKESKSR